MMTKFTTKNTCLPRRQSSAARAAAGAVLLFLCAAGADPIVAERGHDHLTLSQARAILAALPDEARRKLASDQPGLQNLLRDTLLQRALLSQAQSQNWEKRPEIASLLRRQHDAIVSQTYLASKAALPTAYPSDEEVRAAYARNQASFMQPRRYHLLQFYTGPVAKAGAPDGEKPLSELRAKLAGGTVTFAAGASSGNIHFADMGWVTEAQLSPAARPEIVGLQENAITSPICIDGVCHLIKLVGTRPAGPTPLPELRDGLMRALRQEKQRREEDAYAASLLAQSPVLIDQKTLERLRQ